MPYRESGEIGPTRQRLMQSATELVDAKTRPNGSTVTFTYILGDTDGETLSAPHVATYARECLL